SMGVLCAENVELKVWCPTHKHIPFSGSQRVDFLERENIWWLLRGDLLPQYSHLLPARNLTSSLQAASNLPSMPFKLFKRVCVTESFRLISGPESGLESSA